jgi:peptide/nickel transport system ATP-binding protein
MSNQPSGEVGNSGMPLLSVKNLTKHFPLKSGIFGGSKAVVRAVDGISFDVAEGETLGIVGESGCGKSTTARLLVDLITPDSGDIRLGGKRLGSEISIRDLRRDVQMVFQDSYASLNPRLTMEDAIAFGPIINGMSEGQATAHAHTLLHKVGLEPKRYAGRYPHELSGGQRQRVNIARALAFSPKIVILDEAVSALDKSVEAQVLNLLCDLKSELGLTYIFISHDLNVVRYMSDRVMVMYLGEVAEIGPVDSLYSNPAHPYSRALLAAMPSMDPDKRTFEAPLQGDPPNPINPPSGCRFHTRCSVADAVCSQQSPSLHPQGTNEHLAACHVTIPGSGHKLGKVAP